jgi:hypothetical protein
MELLSMSEQWHVNVGVDHETVEFVVESISRWWHQTGNAL